MIPGSVNPLLLKSAAATPGGLQIERSLRFNSSDSSYLSRAVGTAGSLTTWTWAGWVKRSELNTNQALFSGSAANTGRFGFLADNTFFLNFNFSLNNLVTSQVFRDTSAWYHIVCVADTTNATSTDRFKLYVNGNRVTAFSSTLYPPINSTGTINTVETQNIGRRADNSAFLFGGYLTNIHFIDGQALTPSSFTETDATTGQLIPKTYTGSYGTNGFNLLFADNSSNTASTLGKDYSGLGNNWTPNNFSVLTGGPTSVAAASGALPIYNTTDTYGTTKGTGTRTDSNSSSIVLAIPMDGTNNGTTFTDESATIKGSGSAKTISRFGDTKTSTAQSKFYGSSGFFDGTGDYLQAPAGTDFSYGTGDFTFEAWIYPTTSGTDRIIYAQTTSGNNYVNVALTTSNTFSVQINTSGTGNNVTSTGTVTANVWTHIAVTRQSTVVKLFINGVQDGSGTRNVDLQISSTVPTIGTFSHTSTLNFAGYIQDFRIYKGVAKYTANFNPPSSTQNPSIAAGNDSLVDSPTNYGTDTGVGGEVRGNYAVLNPLAGSQTLANGNLDFANNTTDSHRPATIAMTTGKWYCEMTVSSSFGVPGLVPAGFTGTYPGQTSNSWGWYGAGGIYNNAGNIFGATFAANDVIQIAFDADAGKLWFGKNGAWLNSGNPAAGTGQIASPGAGTWCFAAGGSVVGAVTLTTNFGQRAFAYTAPSGFKALCTTNLPAPLVTKSNTVMDVALYTGNGTTQTVTGLAFNPDLVWLKRRDTAQDHNLYDSVRGSSGGYVKQLYSNSTNPESAYGDGVYGGVTALTSDGFSMGSSNSDYRLTNASGSPYVAWTWDAGTSTVSNTQGSITSQVRANATAGFSVVTWTASGTSSTQTVGHGLGIAPAMVICKSRTDGTTYNEWMVYHSSLSASNNVRLNSTGAQQTFPTYGVLGSPTSSAITLTAGSSGNFNVNSGNMVAYCFAPVVGYSSFGSYTGNGSSDGPFVFLGFRPGWVMIKRTDLADTSFAWRIMDTKRSTANTGTTAPLLAASATDAEGAANAPDLLSNGFKWRVTDGNVNANGGTYIYAAFAEAPFNYSRAR